MRTIRLLLGTAILVIFATVATTDDKPTTARGVVVDLRGPPDAGFTLDYYITLEGQKKPVHHPVSCGGWDPTDVKGEIGTWRPGGYVLEIAGPTHVRFVGWKDKDGKVIPVTAIKIESRDLPAEQLPKVVPKKG